MTEWVQITSSHPTPSAEVAENGDDGRAQKMITRAKKESLRLANTEREVADNDVKMSSMKGVRQNFRVHRKLEKTAHGFLDGDGP